MRNTSVKTMPKVERKVETRREKARRLLAELERIRERAAKTHGRHPDAVTTIREIRSGR